MNRLAVPGLLAIAAVLAAAFLPSAAGAQGFGDLQKTGDHLVHWLAFVIEIAGIVIIGLGAVITSLFFLMNMIGRRELAGAYHSFRGNLGRAILLGLEFLVAADIIGTVAVDPTLRNLGVLAIIVLIRTFLSFSLEVEIEGKWPWQRDSHGSYNS